MRELSPQFHEKKVAFVCELRKFTITFFGNFRESNGLSTEITK